MNFGQKRKKRKKLQTITLKTNLKATFLFVNLEIEVSGKTELKNTPIVFLLCLVQKQTSLDGKNRNLTKNYRRAKSLRIFLKTFCFSDLCCQTKIQKKLRKKANNKKATDEGRPRPLIFHPNRPKILKITSPFLG